MNFIAKFFSVSGIFMAFPYIFPFKKLIFIYAQLKIMCDRKYFPQTLLHRNCPVLNDSYQHIPRIHQCSKQEIIKIIIDFFTSFFFPGYKIYFIFLRQKDPCGFRAGK